MRVIDPADGESVLRVDHDNICVELTEARQLEVARLQRQQAANEGDF